MTLSGWLTGVGSLTPDEAEAVMRQNALDIFHAAIAGLSGDSGR